jgi:hypothetical protein
MLAGVTDLTTTEKVNYHTTMEVRDSMSRDTS